MFYTVMSILNGFADFSTLVVPCWAIFLTMVAGYLAFQEN